VKPPQSTVADIAGIDFLIADALADQIHADLEIRDQHGAGLLEDFRRSADVIVMAMGQKHMGDTLRGLFPATLPDGIANQIGVDQDRGVAGFDTESGMAIPGQFHGERPRLYLFRDFNSVRG
jgi:hypothetical protein